MARIKYSALVTGMSGKLNGSVMARNKGGAYVRNKTTPTNPRTTYQQLARSTFGLVSSSWRGLSQSVVKAWNDLAGKVPYTDYWGDQRFLSGFALHQKFNTNLATARVPTFSNPPELLQVSEIGELAAELDGTAETLKFQPTIFPEDANTRILVFATPNIPTGRTFVKNDFRLIGAIAPTGSSIDLTNAYVARFGTLRSVNRIFLRAVVIMTDSGQNSVGFTQEVLSS